MARLRGCNAKGLAVDGNTRWGARLGPVRPDLPRIELVRASL